MMDFLIQQGAPAASVQLLATWHYLIVSVFQTDTEGAGQIIHPQCRSDIPILLTCLILLIVVP
jgi:hypothetical protein